MKTVVSHLASSSSDRGTWQFVGCENSYEPKKILAVSSLQAASDDVLRLELVKKP